jgi:hypothetical protein
MTGSAVATTKKILTAKTHDCRDAGGRATHGAVAERMQSALIVFVNIFSLRTLRLCGEKWCLWANTD